MADLNDATQNVAIHDEAADQPVTTTVVGSKRFLDVNANSDPTQYTLETDYNTTGTVVTSASDVTLFTTTGSGTIDFIAVTCGNSSGYEIIIEVDSSEKFRITMTDLGSTLGLTSDASPIRALNANKQFRYHPNEAKGYTTNFSVKAKATGSDVTLTHLIIYKELQT